MTKRKHPQDRAERLKINEEKKTSDGKNSNLKRVSKQLAGTVPSDRKDI
jgi:hypothetical protein